MLQIDDIHRMILLDGDIKFRSSDLNNHNYLIDTPL